MLFSRSIWVGGFHSLKTLKVNAIDHHPFLVFDFTNALLVLAVKGRPLGLRRLKLVGVASDNWCLDGLISVFEQGGLPDLVDLDIHGYGDRK